MSGRESFPVYKATYALSQTHSEPHSVSIPEPVRTTTQPILTCDKELLGEGAAVKGSNLLLQADSQDAEEDRGWVRSRDVAPSPGSGLKRTACCSAGRRWAS